MSPSDAQIRQLIEQLRSEQCIHDGRTWRRPIQHVEQCMECRWRQRVIKELESLLVAAQPQEAQNILGDHLCARCGGVSRRCLPALPAPEAPAVSQEDNWFARQRERTAQDIKELPDWLRTKTAPTVPPARSQQGEEDAGKAYWRGFQQATYNRIGCLSAADEIIALNKEIAALRAHGASPSTDKDTGHE